MTYFGCFFWTLTKNELFLHSRGINFPPRPITMAKGSAMGLWKGKKGSSVFYRIANSNSQQKQGIRERAFEISNPRTTSQAGQRMKLLPAQRVYGVLKPIISRGWQGVKYGVESKQEYLKRALKLTSGYPYLEKDSSVVVPGAYQISKGTLQQVYTQPSTDGDADSHETSLKITPNGEEITIGDIFTKLLESNSYLRDGDQITIVGCYQTNSDEIIWDYFSFIIDTNDTTEINERPYRFANGALNLYWDINNNNNTVDIKTAQTFMLASAVIVSRLSDGEYLRSTSVLAINDSAGGMQNYFNGAAYRRARNSYMNPTRVQSTDWPVEPELPDNSYISDYALSGLTGNKASANGIVVLVTRNEETDALTGVFVKNFLGNALVKKSDGTAVTYEVTAEGETQVFPITPADQADLANLPTIQYE